MRFITAACLRLIDHSDVDSATNLLLDRLISFLFPGGKKAALDIRAVRSFQTGDMFASANSKPTPFTAEETIEADRSGFRWEARFRTGMRVIDAYEQGSGRLTVTMGGILPLKKLSGPEFDKGELQRYLAYPLGMCPPMILNNSSLRWRLAGENILRVSDSGDRTGASLDIEIGDEGHPLGCRAERPRWVGTRAVLTPWSGVATDFFVQDGIRFARVLESRWHVPEMFTAVRITVNRVEIIR